MGWFDEQIKQRIELDEEEFDQALYKIADAVTGENLSKVLESQKDSALGEIADIIKSYGCKPLPFDGEFSDINEQIDAMCRPCGIMHRSVVLKEDWYRNAFCSYLAVNSESGELVALIPSSFNGSFKYFDNNAGNFVKITKKNKSLFEGDAIVFYKPLPMRKLTVKDLFKFGMSFWSFTDVMWPVLLTVVGTLLGLLVPKLNHFLMNEVYSLQSVPFLVSTVIFLVCLSVTKLLTQSINGMISSGSETKTELPLESALMMRMLSLPVSFYKNYSSGELSQRLSYANSSCDLIITLIFGGGLSALLSLVYISQMVKYGKGLLAPAFIIIGLSLLFSLLLSFCSVKYNKKMMEAQTKESGITYELISGVQKIKLSGSEKRAFARWSEKYADLVNTSLNTPIIIRRRSVISLAITLLGIILMYSFAIKSGVSLADYYSFSTAYSMVSASFSTMLVLGEMVAHFSSIKSMIKPILDAEPEVESNRKTVKSLSGNIEINNVSFSYSESMPPVLNNLSLKIKAGQYVAIVGKTGCGKSTLMRILLGFEKPQRGAVYYDGKDLNTLDLQSLRRRIGTVMQEGKLFAGDIYSNIVVSAPYLTLDDAWQAAEMSGLADDIRNMPMGMHTMISEGSGGISGGQRQRLMIARAIAPKPSILFFDEATSALDNITQKIVSDSLDSLNCTRIVIAHRLSTIKNCDRIIFLDEGKIAEDGTYDELIEKNGLFAELVQRQQLEEE